MKKRILSLLLAGGFFGLPYGGRSAFAVEASSPTLKALTVGGAQIEVTMDPKLTQSSSEVLSWVNLAGTAVTTYYGHFPVPKLKIFVSPRRGNAVNSGTAYRGRRIVIHLGPQATAEDLNSDWILTHEMFHLGFPSLDPDYHYLEEGLSDYLEPLARARIGNLSEGQVWKEFIEGMPKGLPRDGKGLDGTADWGRTYWGGCIFWLLVDLDIREKTRNRASLDDSIRAIVAAGGTENRWWTLEQVIDVGDGATGTGSIRKIHDQLGLQPFDPGLDSLWKKLGVHLEGERLTFDDSAPFAEIRRSMTAKGFIRLPGRPNAGQ